MRVGATTATRVRLGLAVVILGAAALRAAPLLSSNGVQETADFDEGVYLSAAGLFSQGAMPYEDFVLLHPPGVLLLLWPITSLAPDLLSWGHVLVAARWLAVAIGVLNIVLLYRTVSRWRGPGAGLVAAGLYAVHRPAIYVEQHLLLEPFVVLLVLAGATAWLSDDTRRIAVRGGTAGAVLAFAGLVKLTGGLAVLAALASPPQTRPGRATLALLSGTGAAVAVVGVGLLLNVGPGKLWRQVVLAQTSRPGDDVAGGSVTDLSGRLAEVGRIGVLSSDLVPAVLAAAGLLSIAAAGIWAVLRGGRQGRFWTVALVALLGAPLLAPDWYIQYPVPGSVPACALLGAGTAEVVRVLRHRSVSAARGLVVAVVVVLGLAFMDAGRQASAGRPVDAVDFAAQVAAVVPLGSCLVAEPPDLGLAAGRLPVRDASGTYLVDPFGTAVVLGLEAGAHATTSEVLLSPPAQQRLRQAFEACRFVALRAEPDESPRMSDETARWFEERFDPVPSAVSPRATLWVRSG